MAGHRQRSEGSGSVGRKTKKAHNLQEERILGLPPSPDTRYPPPDCHPGASFATKTQRGIAKETRYCAGKNGRESETRERGRKRKTPGANEFLTKLSPTSSFIARNQDYRCDSRREWRSAKATQGENVSAIDYSVRSFKCRDITIYPCRRLNVQKSTIVSDSDGGR